jgi:acyl transferase domain-containing protein/acyl carrier protein
VQGAEIAIIGLAGKFPGAPDVLTFWENLAAGVESIRFLTDDELKQVDEALASNPRYVRSRGGVLADTEYFDHSFFNYTPREAEIMDPQFRIFHECVWAALEDAGYANEKHQSVVGLYAGASGNFHWQQKLANASKYKNRSGLAGIQFVERDFLPTLISYNLNLKGPSYNVQTACSTSLVAVHLACQAILNGECQIALAGGVSIASNTEHGYLYQDGSVLSPDGHCRAFDAQAKGSIYGSGAGAVALKLLEEAITDRDHIYAVIKGSAINNDGKSKVGFTAPSILGQVEVIKAAHQIAEIDSHSISYIEAHGTGTALGDPIEVEALRMAFQAKKKNFCAIGSVKTNIGHLDVAAGVTGLIKTALALKFKKIPPSINFTTPNPKIDFANSPFFVVDSLREWPSGSTPRLAGVSSFGIGGTNAHVVVEEAPVTESRPSERACHILPFSAKSKTSCQRWLQAFSEYLQTTPDGLGDIAHTLIDTRMKFNVRGFLVATDADDAIRKIDTGSAYIGEAPANTEVAGALVFMFPGQGSQYVKMGYGLFKREPFFRNELMHGMEVYKAMTQHDLGTMLYPTASDDADASIDDTRFTQPLLFIFEYSLAKFLMHLGVVPAAMVGHSIGEYVAACLSGVLSFKDALSIVIKRGSLIQAMPKGAMLSVPLAEKEISNQVPASVSIAAVNSDNQCVVSGPTEDILRYRQQLASTGVDTVLLHTSHAFHSGMMEPVLEEFRKVFNSVQLHRPGIPFYSNVTGKLITAAEATSPAYWVNHIRHTVRFSDCVAKILAAPHATLIEVGPGNALSNFVARNAAKKPLHKIIGLVRHVKQSVADDQLLCEALGKLWAMGAPVALDKLYDDEVRKKVSMPTYCFEKIKINTLDEEKPGNSTESTKICRSDDERNDFPKWFYEQTWKRQSAMPPVGPAQDKTWVLFLSESKLADAIRENLSPGHITIVTPGTAFTQHTDNHYSIEPGNEEDYRQLVAATRAGTADTLNVIHAWSLAADGQALSSERCTFLMNRTFYSIINLIRALGFKAKAVDLTVVTQNTFDVVGGECLFPELATVSALVKVLPLEYNYLTARMLDVDQKDIASERSMLGKQIVSLSKSTSKQKVLAWRGNYAWAPATQPLPLHDTNDVQPTLFGDHKTYVILGLGGMGVYVAKYLAEHFKSTVYVLHRGEFPEREAWEKIATQNPNTEVARKVRVLMELEQNGKGTVKLVMADITDLVKMREVVGEIEKNHGSIQGIVHAAGAIDSDGMVQRRTNQSIHDAMRAKVQGTLVIDRLFSNKSLEFFILFSSLGNELYEHKFGEVGYNAANEFVDAYAHTPSDTINRKLVINWCDWSEVGMSVKAIEKMFGGQEARHDMMQGAIAPEEGIKVFAAVTRCAAVRTLVYPLDLQHRLAERDRVLENYAAFLEEKFKAITTVKTPASPVVGASLLDNVTSVWKDYLGHDQIGVHDNIFELGASSLDVVQVNNVLKSALKIDVPVTTLFEYPTIASFINHIEGRAESENAGSAERIDRGINKLDKLKKISTINK